VQPRAAQGAEPYDRDLHHRHLGASAAAACPPPHLKYLHTGLNGFDIPKLYFREHVLLQSQPEDDSQYKYAIIDGKQRLTSIWEFMDGRFALSEDFEFLRDTSINAGGLTYSELGAMYPTLLLDFDQTNLPIVTITTDDEELIEEMFSRLNEAVPLTAAEKRNAFGGPLPTIVRHLAAHEFFTNKLPFANSRYRHYDIAAKMLLFEHQNGVADTKKIYLDDLVKDFRKLAMNDPETSRRAELLGARVTAIVESMTERFIDDDPLLRPVGMISIYYLLFREARESHHHDQLTRSNLQAFESRRENNRREAEDNMAQASYPLLEFDRLAQSPNDGVALKYRLSVLQSFIYKTTEAEDFTSSLRSVDSSE
jgi:hypothetical protein